MKSTSGSILIFAAGRIVSIIFWIKVLQKKTGLIFSHKTESWEEWKYFEISEALSRLLAVISLKYTHNSSVFCNSIEALQTRSKNFMIPENKSQLKVFAAIESKQKDFKTKKTKAKDEHHHLTCLFLFNFEYKYDPISSEFRVTKACNSLSDSSNLKGSL